MQDAFFPVCPVCGNPLQTIGRTLFDGVETIIACGDFFDLLLFFVGINEAILPDIFSLITEAKP